MESQRAFSLQRVYLIGAGVIAGHHLRNLPTVDGASGWECHICDLRPEALQKLHAEFPTLQLYSSAEVMLATPAQPDDIVIICTPPSSHAALTIRSLESGRHVLCEKPLFSTTTEIDRVEEVMREHPTRLLACCSNRFAGTESLQQCRELVAAGRIGSVYRARWIHRLNRRRSGIEFQPEARWFLNRRLNGGGVTMDWGPYDISSLFLILRPERVTVRSCLMSQVETGAVLPPATIFDVETQVIAQLDCYRADGSVVRVDYERAAATHGREDLIFEFEGTRGAIGLEWIAAAKLWLSEDRDGAVVRSEIPVNGDQPRHARPMREMVKAVRGQDSLTESNAVALFNFRCLLALYEAAETGHSVEVHRKREVQS